MSNVISLFFPPKLDSPTTPHVPSKELLSTCPSKSQPKRSPSQSLNIHLLVSGRPKISRRTTGTPTSTRTQALNQSPSTAYVPRAPHATQTSRQTRTRAQAWPNPTACMIRTWVIRPYFNTSAPMDNSCCPLNHKPTTPGRFWTKPSGATRGRSQAYRPGPKLETQFPRKSRPHASTTTNKLTAPS